MLCTSKNTRYWTDTPQMLQPTFSTTKCRIKDRRQETGDNYIGQ
ncbi:MAG: hypothetical protein AB4080_25820 [Trichodesmium sp.]